jgi:hypothetical protein
VAVIFSQDRELSEAMEEVKTIGKEPGRWIYLVSACPQSSPSPNARGIDRDG